MSKSGVEETSVLWCFFNLFGVLIPIDQGAPQREELAEVDVDWLIAERPGRVKTLKQHPRKNKTAINIEYMKASIRARVEHPFRIIKRQFGFVKARYKGLLKNDNQLAMLFTLANLFRVDQMIRQWERSQ